VLSIVSGSLGHGGLLAESLLAFGVDLLLETLEGCLKFGNLSTQRSFVCWR